MKKRAVSSLLAFLAVVSLILPALATVNLFENEETPPVVEQTDPEEPEDPEGQEDPEDQEDPESPLFLDGEPLFIELELRRGTAYVTVDSFVSIIDPQAVVEEEDGVVTVSSAVVEQIVDDEGNTANVVQETLSMTVSTQVPYILANGRYLYAKDNIIMLNDRVAAPVRILAKVFNLDTAYDSEAHAVLLTHSEDSCAYIQPGDSYYDDDALFWLSRIIYAESGNQCIDGKIAVGNVVMNRVNSPLFPDNIYDVLNQKNQFSPASSLSKRTPNSESILAAKLVMDGALVVPTALYFNTVGLYSWAARNRSYVTTIGAHAFYA